MTPTNHNHGEYILGAPANETVTVAGLASTVESNSTLQLGTLGMGTLGIANTRLTSGDRIGGSPLFIISSYLWRRRSCLCNRCVNHCPYPSLQFLQCSASF